MINKNISFSFNPKIDSKLTLTKMVNKAYLKNKKFFGQDIPNVKITFLYTRSQMNRVCGYKTPDWLVGYAPQKHIYIFSPSVFDKVSSHPATDFPYTLTHEITHIFSNTLLGFYYPIWLHEGLAGYVAEQYKIRKVKKIDNFSKLHDSKSWQKYSNYSQAFLFTKYLIDTFGKEKTLNFLKQLHQKVGRHHYHPDFIKFFNQFFKSAFNQLASKWKNQN